MGLVRLCNRKIHRRWFRSITSVDSLRPLDATIPKLFPTNLSNSIVISIYSRLRKVGQPEVCTIGAGNNVSLFGLVSISQ